jgi:hypothetical protein
MELRTTRRARVRGVADHDRPATEPRVVDQQPLDPRVRGGTGMLRWTVPAIPRRVVTGHDERGVSVFAVDGAVPVVRTAPDGALFCEIWATGAMPARSRRPSPTRP